MVPYTWGADCLGFRLVEGGELTLTEEIMPPARAERRHFHRRACQIFYVLGGELSLEVEGARYGLAAGDALVVPPGTSHSVQNDGTAAVSFLVIAAPSAVGDREDV